MRHHGLGLVWVAVVAVVAAAACTEAPTAAVTTAPPSMTELSLTEELLLASDDLVRCANREPAIVTGSIGPLGGVLSAGAHAIAFPNGAVSHLTAFTIVVPASGIAEVDITALGVEHFVFNKPVSITISYAGCEVQDQSTLTAWYIEPLTRKKLEKMGGVVDTAARTLTFSTGHLSGYAIAD